MNIAYIYRLTNNEGLKYIGSHLVARGKTIYTDTYSGSSQDPRINTGIICKEILCYLQSEDRKLLYNYIQCIEHDLILDLDAINQSEYANATNMGVIGLNYKRLGGIMSNIKSPRSKAQQSTLAKKGAAASKHARTSDWHRKGQLAGAKSRRTWTKEVYNDIIKAHQKHPDKKAYAIWTIIGRPTKSYKPVYHMLNLIMEGKSWEDIC